jgi:hypothetical protein
MKQPYLECHYRNTEGHRLEETIECKHPKATELSTCMNSCIILRKNKACPEGIKYDRFTIEYRRELSASRMGVKHTEETKANMRGHDNRPFPPKCIKCPSRDAGMCARYNQRCFDARVTMCFKRVSWRVVHKDYRKKVKECR